MTNNYDKMRRSNSKARKWLIEQGFEDIHFFPHTRFQKGANIKDEEFDGMCIDDSDCKMVLFQIKSNHKISKKRLDKYKDISNRYNIKCLWINIRDRREMEVQGA